MKSKGPGLIIDSFAGGGGASLGIQWALGRGPDIAINHDPAAVAMHAANHPETVHVMEDVWRTDLRRLTKGKPVALLWASPDCRHFSRAKGGKPVSKSVRSLASIVVRWAKEVQPELICLENVREFADWGPLVPAWRCAACDWLGTEGQAILARSRRRCPRCESLRLRETGDLLPDPERKGQTFRRWKGQLRCCGYRVEVRVLDAADFGARTHRKRLFVVARRNGGEIHWPQPTHFDPQKLAVHSEQPAWRTAAECIDWSIPCPSIFEREKPLAENTLKRIAHGIKRFVLDHPQPFLVRFNTEKSPGDFRGQSLGEPFSTLDTQNRFGVVTPVVMRYRGDAASCSSAFGEPMPTVTANSFTKRPGGAAPLACVAPILAPITHTGERRCHSPEEPLPTITTAHRGELAVVAPSLIHISNGERDGQRPRAKSIEDPLGTIVAGGNKHYLVAALLAKHFGGSRPGRPACGLDEPAGTITGVDHHSLVAANLIHLNNHTHPTGFDSPLWTVASGGNHAALVYAFLVKYFGTAIGQELELPMHTLTGKARFGLVTVVVAGELYAIVDIGMRMLEPRELARAQGFPDTYILTGTKTQQVARIGNSVCPHVAAAVVLANRRAIFTPSQRRRKVAA